MSKQQRDALRKLIENVSKDDLLRLGLTNDEANAVIALYTWAPFWEAK